MQGRNEWTENQQDQDAFTERPTSLLYTLLIIYLIIQTLISFEGLLKGLGDPCVRGYVACVLALTCGKRAFLAHF